MQCRRRVTRSGDGVQLALRMRIPNLRPLVLPSAREETQGFAVLAFVGETAQAFARLGVALGAAKSDALELARFDIVRLELARALEDIQRIARPVEPDKRAAPRCATPRIRARCSASPRQAPECRRAAACAAPPRRGSATLRAPARTR